MSVSGLGLTGMIFDSVAKAGTNYAAQCWGCVLGFFIYLVDPGAAFAALWVAVVLDLLSRIFAEAKSHGGLYRAAKEGHIRSDKMLCGTMAKIVAYFFMCVLANQSKHIFGHDAPAEMFSTVVYSILFLVEVWSMCENFEEAGVNSFSWISRFAKNKLETLAGGEGEEGPKDELTGTHD